ncbi:MULTISPECIES: enoyl-CoA hydratase-related protein [unclassified Pseudomonas]|uniref:enoyl-CoA hydratase-related protein n=1 Tax=unclassified Pseudomonas TaxID=196821 RepID=UPI0025F5F5E3|nr:MULTISPECIES: enoyl-CoA hydratase-related protein [unclassified Pseudomonas]
MTDCLPVTRFVHTQIVDRVAVVTLNRPPVNALDSVTIRELTATFNALARSRDASVIVFTAPGDNIFCAGIDLKDSSRRHARELVEDDSAIDLLDPGAVVRECFWAILECPLPVIAAVNGKAIGAGLVLVASCDLVVAAEHATFSVPEIKAGVLGGARHLQRLVGPFKTRKMFFTGEPVPAQEFYRLGAFEAVVASDKLMETAMQLASQIARHSPIGLRLGKESLSRVEDLSLKDGYRIEQDYTGRVTRYADSAEARQAYLNKREPDWSWS